MHLKLISTLNLSFTSWANLGLARGVFEANPNLNQEVGVAVGVGLI